jgi:hypothetical protein
MSYHARHSCLDLAAFLGPSNKNYGHCLTYFSRRTSATDCRYTVVYIDVQKWNDYEFKKL